MKWTPTYLASPWVPKLISSFLSVSIDYLSFSSSSETIVLAFLAAIMATGRLPSHRPGVCVIVQLKSSM